MLQVCIALRVGGNELSAGFLVSQIFPAPRGYFFVQCVPMHCRHFTTPKMDEQGGYVGVMIAGDFYQLHPLFSARLAQLFSQGFASLLPSAYACFCRVSHQHQHVAPLRQFAGQLYHNRGLTTLVPQMEVRHKTHNGTRWWVYVFNGSQCLSVIACCVGARLHTGIHPLQPIR